MTPKAWRPKQSQDLGGRVLRNLLSIKRVGDINEAESQALLLAQSQGVDFYSDDQRFTAQDICDLHRLWLAPIYIWAGQYRSVNISKAGFQFAHAAWIQGLMAKLERGVLSAFTHASRQTTSAQQDRWRWCTLS